MIKNLIVFFTALFLINTGYSQNDTVRKYIDYYGKETSKDKAEYLRLKLVEDNIWKIKDYYLTGELQMEGIYKSKRYKKKVGKFSYYYKDGNLSLQGTYLNNKMVGVWKDWFENGNLYSIETFNKKGKKEGEFKYNYNNGHTRSKGVYFKNKKEGSWKWYYNSGQVSSDEIYVKGGLKSYVFFDEKGNKVKEEVVNSKKPIIIGEEPEFDGGINGLHLYLKKEVTYPQEAENQKIGGKVIVGFVVDKNGEVENVRIINSVHKLLDEEALRVVRAMPKWKPGKQHNLRVKASYTLPINFKI